MTELFGGFPREFYSTYDEVFPREDGYERRKHLYNLYHLLNHLNVFGGGYLRQVRATLSLLRLG
jgi:fructosamine-3-kinase